MIEAVSEDRIQSIIEDETESMLECLTECMPGKPVRWKRTATGAVGVVLLGCLVGSAVAQTAAPAAAVPHVDAPILTAYALCYQEIRPGSGPAALPGMTLTVQYTGWLAADGTKFDSSRDRASAQFPAGEPFQFVLGAHRVIPGWDTGLVGMRVGGIRRLLIPWQLAYGMEGRPPVIPPRADLIFDVELLDATTPEMDDTGPPGQPPAQPGNAPPAPPVPPQPPAPPVPPQPPAPPTPPNLRF